MAQTRKLRSASYAWSSGGTIVVDLNFLAAALGFFRAPVIRALRIWARFNVDTGAGGGPGRLLPRLFSKVQLNDGSTTRVDLSGWSMRAVLQQEYGQSWSPPRFVAANSNDVNVDLCLPLPVGFLPKAKRQRDYGIPVSDILKGGSLILSLRTGTAIGGATEFTVINSGTIEIEAEIEEGRTPEIKSRLCWREYAWTQGEDFYPVAGFLRALLAGAGPTDEDAATYLADQNVSSTSLDISNIPQKYFARAYREESRPLTALETLAAVAGDDLVLQSNAVTPNFLDNCRFLIPIVTPSREQKIALMSPLDKVHVKFESGTVPAAGGVMIVGSIKGRDAALAAEVFRAPSVGAAIETLKTRARVKAVDSTKPASSFTDALQAALPVKL